ncbi:hypothetical protein KAX02_06420 [candidate division WOR-3 bacterium]|nr:hypothetical protein [candidate division WOR-3 bacterium]
MLRKLTAEEIEGFASRENVKRIPVENFLMTVTNNDNITAALNNLEYDGKVYYWNRETMKAINEGIHLSGGMS